MLLAAALQTTACCRCFVYLSAYLNVFSQILCNIYQRADSAKAKPHVCHCKLRSLLMVAPEDATAVPVWDHLIPVTPVAGCCLMQKKEDLLV